MTMRQDAEQIIRASLQAVQPDAAVQRALEDIRFEAEGRLILVAIGKAAWQMAKAASHKLGGRIHSGIVITKYDHVMGPLPNLLMREAGHPVPDANGFAATEEAIALVQDLTPRDSVLLLISGGGSALFESPLIPGEELQSITDQLLRSGADIVEINTIRKRLSRVKGGRFAQLCAPARVYAVVLSDILGDPLDMIASGPATPDTSTTEDALRVVKKYALYLSPQAEALLQKETPKALANVRALVTGSVRHLCEAAAKAAATLGYHPHILADSLSCQAREAGSFMGSIARRHQSTGSSLAFIVGGETVVKLTGSGKGGRNHELALAAAKGLQGTTNTALFSLGSDGTDGPTDAAGGYVDQDTALQLAGQGVDIDQVLQQNDAYHALERVGGLLMTGPTGTNVNDVSVLLIRRGALESPSIACNM
ncbi:MAG: glycerate kinase [Clostridiales bacterium]|nr:glycerate kinase [Clostridiales bacterium]